ncbi:MAG: hypothetical protein MJ234_01750 [bacterium]|nr:hypothetical protein [bacterium]
MQITSSMPSLTPYQLSSAEKVINEFKNVEAQMIAADNDTVDLNSAEGEVKVDFKPLKEGAREKFTGEVTYNKETKEAEKTFVTKNYDKPGGVGVNYAKHQLEDGSTYYRKDDMYQEYPMYRQIDEIVVGKDGQIKSFESYEERDEFSGFGGFGGGDEFYIAH